MFCGSETVHVSRDEAEENIDNRGPTKRTAFPISSVSRDTLSTNETHEKENFDD